MRMIMILSQRPGIVGIGIAVAIAIAIGFSD